MEDSRIPKDVLYSEITTGIRTKGCTVLRYKDVYRHDMKVCDIDPETWEPVASDCASWRCRVIQGLKRSEGKRNTTWQEKRQWHKEKANRTQQSASDVL